MRCLDDIVRAVRLNEPATEEELRYCLVAYDVMLAKMGVSGMPDLLPEFFRAATSDPRKYVGPDNDPEQAHAVRWYAEMRRISDELESQPPAICGECGKALPGGCHYTSEADGCALIED